jgi:hypothetical protein
VRDVKAGTLEKVPASLICASGASVLSTVETGLPPALRLVGSCAWTLGKAPGKGLSPERRGVVCCPRKRCG